MTNTFKIIGANGQLLASNSSEDAFDYWLNDYAYASYIVIMSDEYTLYKRSKLASYNCDVEGGELYAAYTTEISETEFPYPITGIGFAPYLNAKPCSVCEVSLSSSSLSIYATIKLDFNCTLKLFQGENAFIKSLLGICAKTDLTVLGRKEPVPNDIDADIEKYSSVNSQSSYLNGSGSVTFASNGMSDFLILSGEPIARYNLAYDAAFDRTALYACSGGGFYADKVKSVSSVKQNGISADFAAYNLPIGVLTEKSDVASLDLKGFELFTDPSFNHLAAINGDTCYVIDPEAMTIKRTVTVSGKAILASDGNVIVADESGNFLFDRNETQISGSFAGQTMVLYRDNGYDVFVYQGDTVEVLRLDYDSTSFKSVTRFTAFEGGRLTCLNNHSVALKSGDVCKIFDRNGEVPLYFSAQTYKYGDIENGTFYDEDGLICNLRSGDSMYCEKHFGKLGMYKNKLYYIGENGIKDLNFSCNAQSVAAVRNYIFVLQDGKPVRYRMAIDGTFVDTPCSGNVQVTESCFGTKNNPTVKLTIHH